MPKHARSASGAIAQDHNSCTVAWNREFCKGARAWSTSLRKSKVSLHSSPLHSRGYKPVLGSGCRVQSRVLSGATGDLSSQFGQDAPKRFTDHAASAAGSAAGAGGSHAELGSATCKWPGEATTIMLLKPRRLARALAGDCFILFRRPQAHTSGHLGGPGCLGGSPRR